MDALDDVDLLTSARFLQDEASPTSTPLTDTEIVKQTCRVYGSIFLVVFLLFLFLRPRYPRIYNIKKSFPSLHSSLADDSFGAISWIWKVFSVSYEELAEHCGMDAMATIRLLEFGVKVSLVGVLNSVFLFPIYSLMGNSDTDPVTANSLGNLGQGSNGAYATTLAAYILFGAAMHFIDKDLEWFTSHRHAFLSKQTVQNYSIYLSGLTTDMQSKSAIREYFERCLSKNSVADVQLALTIPNLEKKVAKRSAVIPKLEHAINVKVVTKETPMHKTKLLGGDKVDSVHTYTKDLEELNNEISADIDRIETLQNDNECSGVINPGVNDEQDEEASGTETKYFHKTTTALSDSVKSGGAKFKSIIFGADDDGAPRNAAFVSFTNLTSANLARQTLHNDGEFSFLLLILSLDRHEFFTIMFSEPWDCVPFEPPLPKLVK